MYQRVGLGAMVLIMAAGQILAADLYVAPGGSHTAPYENWAKAANDIQTALDSASAGDVVYVTNAVFSLTAPVMVTNGVRLVGSNNAAGARAMLNGAGGTRCMTIQDADAVVDGFVMSNGYSTVAGGGVRLEGGLLRACLLFSNIAVNVHGGGLYATAGRVEDCVIRGNLISGTADARGGGAYLAGAGVVADGCLVTENHAYRRGAGLYVGAGAMACNGTSSWNNCAASFGGTGGGLYLDGGTVSNFLIADNHLEISSTDSDALGGAGAYMTGAGALLIASRVVRNEALVKSGATAAYPYGGGVYMANGTVAECVIASNLIGRTGSSLYGGGAGMRVNAGLVRDTIIRHNRGVPNALYGGGVRLMGAGVLLRGEIYENETWVNGGGVHAAGGGAVSDCHIFSNRVTRPIATPNADYRGGGIYCNNASVSNCVIAGNSAYQGGGGVQLNHENDLLRNCLVAGNGTLGGADSGGGGVNLRGGRMENVTVVRNSAGSAGGGGVFRDTGHLSRITNCIIYYNTADGGNPDVANGEDALFGYCCASDGLTAGINGNITSAPAFVDAGSGYGPAAVLGDCHLQGSSPCVNAGVNQAWMTDAVDLGGAPRINWLGRRVDMGCFENIPRGTMFLVQ